MNRYAGLILLLLGLAPAAPASAYDGGAADPPLHFAELGTCTTPHGDILDCRVGYRTAGRLNERRDNAVLIPTWYGGTSANLVRLTGHEAFVDTTRYFVIMLDAIGNGVSISPSNSVRQPGAAFPAVTIGDMVDAARRVVIEHLGIAQLHAIVGFSMGAFQALEWAVRHPTDASRIVSLLGSPRPAAYDTFVLRSLRWATTLGAAALPPDSTYVPVVDLWHTIRMTPASESGIPVDSIDSRVLHEARNGWSAFDVHDNLLQLEAMLSHDVAARFDSDLGRAAAEVQARLLLVTSPDDRIVSEENVIEFGRPAGAEVLSVASRCGHFALYCEPVVAERVRTFMAERSAVPS